jgi:hypothetical protein
MTAGGAAPARTEATGMLDPASASTVRRFGLCTALVVGWWLATWAAGRAGGAASLGAMLLVAGASAAVLAVAAGDRPRGPSLNRWDEAAAYLALAALLRAAG